MPSLSLDLTGLSRKPYGLKCPVGKGGRSGVWAFLPLSLQSGGWYSLGSHPYGLPFTHETYEKNKDAWLKQPPKLWEEVMGRKNSRSSTYGAWDLSSHRSPFTLG